MPTSSSSRSCAANSSRLVPASLPYLGRKEPAQLRRREQGLRQRGDFGCGRRRPLRVFEDRASLVEEVLQLIQRHAVGAPSARLGIQAVQPVDDEAVAPHAEADIELAQKIMLSPRARRVIPLEESAPLRPRPYHFSHVEAVVRLLRVVALQADPACECLDDATDPQALIAALRQLVRGGLDRAPPIVGWRLRGRRAVEPDARRDPARH